MSQSASETVRRIEAQPGPQTMFLSSSADVVIYGGAAGGAKSFGLLLDPLRYITNTQGFGAVIFRRTIPQITKEGSLWDTSQQIYRYAGGIPKQSPKLKWDFPPFNNSIGFDQLQFDDTVSEWDGSQIAMLGFDELQHFTKKQFLYMLSRNRSACGVKPYVRATCNPMPDSWILELIGWWIDPLGYAIKERSGIIRYFVTVSGSFVTADSQEELLSKYPQLLPKSFTFIRSDIYDNQILLKADPGYLANLNSLPEYERERLLKGNWKARKVGPLFRYEWYKWIEREAWDQAPVQLTRVVIGVDPSGGHGPTNDMQGIVSAGQGTDGKFYILTDNTCALSPAGWGRLAVDTYNQDKGDLIVAEGNFGGEMVESTIQAVDRYANVKIVSASRGKAVRAQPVAALYEKGLIVHVGHHPELEAEMAGFDPNEKAPSPNRMDALVWAVTELMGGKTGVLDYYRMLDERDAAEEAKRK